MTAIILTLVVQVAFGIGNPISAQWLAIRGLQSGQLPTEDSEMFARKGLFSSIGRTTALATVAALALTAVEPSLAVAGPAKKTGLTAATGTSDATDFSARPVSYTHLTLPTNREV